MGRVEGKIVVVTGAAEARALTVEGATVIATDVESPHLEDQGIVRRALDVTSAAAWSELAGWLRSEYGHVEGLVNNAGIPMRRRAARHSLPGFIETPMTASAPEAFRRGQTAHGGAKTLSDAVAAASAAQP